ncbi:MAG: hypothetical protein HGN29_17225 [Asgard group archaeon]|nr:hypothetical protein [Asgard group archaeon]
METKIDFSDTSRKEKQRKRKLGLVVTALIFLILAIISWNIHYIRWLLVFYISISVFVICSIAFLILRNRYKESFRPKEEAVLESKTKIRKLKPILISLSIIDLISIVMIVLSVPQFDIICSGMVCIGPLLTFIVLLIISGGFTIVKFAQFLDIRRVSRT